MVELGAARAHEFLPLAHPDVLHRQSDQPRSWPTPGWDCPEHAGRNGGLRLWQIPRWTGQPAPARWFWPACCVDDGSLRSWFTWRPALRPGILSAAGSTTLPHWLGLVCVARDHLWRGLYVSLHDADTWSAGHCLSRLHSHLGSAPVSHPIHSPAARYYRGRVFSGFLSRTGQPCRRHHSPQAVPRSTSGLVPGSSTTSQSRAASHAPFSGRDTAFVYSCHAGLEPPLLPGSLR